MPPVISDADLWSEMKSGSEKAFSSLFMKYHVSLVSYGKSITQHHYIVGDCIQDVFADIWLYRKTISTPDSVRAYLLSGLRKRIARKLERDQIFKHATDIEHVEFSASFTILDELITNEEMRSQVTYLNAAINQLSPRQKEALYLRYYHQLSVDQIAEMMQMNTQSVSNLLHRAIKQLRNIWKGEIPQLMILLVLTHCLSTDV
ncbi:RNA polymerase sigma factor [Dyadobacter sp. CY343]|uniref:RNA polymerase sigma factor n=1 Tax=Dyadobacter sp. CY343 TaxID=2907299 RepID=UPI001F4886BB|nr:sigma-70 family RNA polymerase sigma factor [Dyadobacter sp. CY343]MCE7062200.1 sigma-70 family RNA polymerase sigma factor [Dyadobacter sp. CY343]